MHAQRDNILSMLSVCLIPLHYLNEYTISSYFLPICRGIILVIRIPPPLQNSKENPLSGGVKYKGVGKFSKYSLSYRGMR